MKYTCNIIDEQPVIFQCLNQLNVMRCKLKQNQSQDRTGPHVGIKLQEKCGFSTRKI